jgi:hypothetical protein
LIQDENSPQFRLLKENAQFSNQDKCKSGTLVSFALALEQFCKSEVASQVELLDLFDRLEFDPFEKMTVCIPLFSGIKSEISDQGKKERTRETILVNLTDIRSFFLAKTIFTSMTQNALSTISGIKSIPNNVIQYFYDSIAHALSQDAYKFDYEKLQSLVQVTSVYCLDKSIVEKIQRLINSKYNKSGKMNDQQFKQSIIEMYNNNPSSVTQILDMTKELDVIYLFKQSSNELLD